MTSFWMEFIAAILGGAIGSGMRFSLASGVQAIWPKLYFPIGILVCNILGSFVIGVLAALFIHRFAISIPWRSFLIVGILGGFTTFSSFSLDTITLWQQGAHWLSLVNIVVSLLGCIFAAAMGFALAS